MYIKSILYSFSINGTYIYGTHYLIKDDKNIKKFADSHKRNVFEPDNTVRS